MILFGGVIVIMISIDMGGWNGIGYVLFGVVLGILGLLMLIMVVIMVLVL